MPSRRVPPFSRTETATPSRRGAPATPPLAGATPLPVLLVRRGPVGIRALGALQDDPRLELVVADDLSATWVSFAQRLSAVMLCTQTDPFDALLYGITAGVKAPIVVVMAAKYGAEAPHLMAAGARACLEMPVERPDVDRLVLLLAGQERAATVDMTLRLLLDPIGRVVRYRDRQVHLSQREFAVLHCLCNRGGLAVPTDELVAYVWGDDSDEDSARKALSVYVFALRKKLFELGIPGGIKTIRGYGYALAPLSASQGKGGTGA